MSLACTYGLCTRAPSSTRTGLTTSLQHGRGRAFLTSMCKRRPFHVIPYVSVYVCSLEAKANAVFNYILFISSCVVRSYVLSCQQSVVRQHRRREGSAIGALPGVRRQLVQEQGVPEPLPQRHLPPQVRVVQARAHGEFLLFLKNVRGSSTDLRRCCVNQAVQATSRRYRSTVSHQRLLEEVCIFFCFPTGTPPRIYQ